MNKHLVLDGFEGRPYKPFHGVRLSGGVLTGYRSATGRGNRFKLCQVWVRIPPVADGDYERRTQMNSE